MTMLDDPAFLLFHTKSAFITSDETGACELVMENEDKFNNIERQRSVSFLKKERLQSPVDNELSHSPDIFPDMDYSGHRFRSNTAQRLEKLLIEKHKQSNIQRITWKEAECDDGIDLREIFEEREIEPLSSKVAKKSMLSQQIQEFDRMQEGNCFVVYAKFDGKALYGTNNNLVKMIDIFLTMAPPTERGFVMNVVVGNNAKIRDLIGLICWQYFMEKREPKLKQDVNLYELYMAEDNGEADRDFPPLDWREPITKFDFARLALVEKNSCPARPEIKQTSRRKSPSPTKMSNLMQRFNIKSSISVRLPNSGVVILNTKEAGKNFRVVRDLLIEVVTKEKLDAKYHLERSGKPGVAIDNDLQVQYLNTDDLCLIKNSSSSSSLVATYTVQMLQKFMPSCEVYLVISDKRIEIHLLKQPVPFSLKQMKQVINIDSLIEIQLKVDDKTSSNGNNCGTFRVSYKIPQGKTKQKTFVCDANVADEIVSRLNRMLLETRS